MDTGFFLLEADIEVNSSALKSCTLSFQRYSICKLADVKFVQGYPKTPLKDCKLKLNDLLIYTFPMLGVEQMAPLALNNNWPKVKI